MPRSAPADDLSNMEDAVSRLVLIGYVARPISMGTEAWSILPRPRIYVMACRADLSRAVADTMLALEKAQDLVWACVQARALQPPLAIPFLTHTDRRSIMEARGSGGQHVPAC